MISSPFVVSVAGLAGDAGGRRDVELQAEINWGVDLAGTGPGLEARLTLENASGTLIARGSAATDLGLTCHRCLAEWTEELTVEITEALGIEGDDEGYPIEDDDTVDLEPMLRDAVLLEVPPRPLCRPDCLGLCATCGADLNTGACPGHHEEEASPFAALRDLLEP